MTGWAGSGRVALTLLLLMGLAACSSGQRASTGAQYGYTAPGPPEDPWGPYINEAANRFSIPDRWIRAVMHQESGGHEYLNGQPITSDAGAAGLMQVMPQTYAELRDQYSLGPDPYNPHDNIIAGAGYIRQMYDRFGSPAFLAAYNAGPQRVEDYMAGRGGLPNETVNYLAAIAPRLGNGLPMSGPLVAYADNGGAPLTPDPVPHAYARRGVARCWRDPDAAYDPDAPCRAAPPVRVASAAALVQPRRQPAGNTCWHDPDAAYDPDAPCRAAPPAVFAAVAPVARLQPRGANCWRDPNAAYDPDAPCRPATGGGCRRAAACDGAIRPGSADRPWPDPVGKPARRAANSGGRPSQFRPVTSSLRRPPPSRRPFTRPVRGRSRSAPLRIPARQDRWPPPHAVWPRRNCVARKPPSALPRLSAAMCSIARGWSGFPPSRPPWRAAC